MNINNYIKKTVIITLLFMSPAVVLANHGHAEKKKSSTKSSLDMNAGIRQLYITWEGSNDSTNTTFKDEAAMIGADLTLRYDKFFGGISLIGGEFKFNGNAPDRPTAPNPASATTAIKRIEFNLIAGYQITRNFSVFTDIQNITNDWKGEDYSIEYTGFGVGANGNVILSPHWIIFGTIGFIPVKISDSSGNNSNDNSDIGNGRGASFELGGTYVIQHDMSMSLSLKVQSREFDYDTALDQTHDISGLMFRFNYTFM